jgi:hypothetical protein
MTTAKTTATSLRFDGRQLTGIGEHAIVLDLLCQQPLVLHADMARPINFRSRGGRCFVCAHRRSSTYRCGPAATTIENVIQHTTVF